jgi:hypothetical protein
MRTPAFVDRMDLADDADGRVAILTVDTSPSAPGGLSGVARRGWTHAGADRVAAWLDHAYAGVGVAAALLVILVLGLLFLRR